MIPLVDRPVGEPHRALSGALHPRTAQLAGELERGGDDPVLDDGELDGIGDLAADHPEGMAHARGVQQLADPVSTSYPRL